MVQYNVKGMSCSACSARVEKAVLKVPGVTSCTVSLLTNSMGVEGTASPESIVAAVKAAGYKASLKKGAGKPAGSSDRHERDRSRRCTCGYGNPAASETTERIGDISAGSHVFFDGTHDVGMAGTCGTGGQPCGDGNFAAFADRHCYGNQPKVFHKRISEPLAQSTEHGYAGCAWCDGGVCVERRRAFSDDGCADARRYARRDDLYG